MRRSVLLGTGSALPRRALGNDLSHPSNPELVHVSILRLADPVRIEHDEISRLKHPLLHGILRGIEKSEREPLPRQHRQH